MTTIDLAQLATVTGGADPRNKAVLAALDKRYSSDGVVSFIGTPEYSGRHVSGKFDVNALWGGDTQYSFSANVSQRGRVSHLHTKVLGSE